MQNAHHCKQQAANTKILTIIRIWLARKTVIKGKMNLHLIQDDPLVSSSSPYSATILFCEA